MFLKIRKKMNTHFNISEVKYNKLYFLSRCIILPMFLFSYYQGKGLELREGQRKKGQKILTDYLPIKYL